MSGKQLTVGMMRTYPMSLPRRHLSLQAKGIEGSVFFFARLKKGEELTRMSETGRAGTLWRGQNHQTARQALR